MDAPSICMYEMHFFKVKSFFSAKFFHDWTLILDDQATEEFFDILKLTELLNKQVFPGAKWVLVWGWQVRKIRPPSHKVKIPPPSFSRSYVSISASAFTYSRSGEITLFIQKKTRLFPIWLFKQIDSLIDLLCDMFLQIMIVQFIRFRGLSSYRILQTIPRHVFFRHC